ncbi:MAG: HNH endonuclease [Sphingobium sp. 66-54]|nr:MAG: HNH endonuclease [Sphingobium sp. 66-54]
MRDKTLLANDSGFCWLCGRALGGRVERHHPVPRAKGGRAAVAVHPICHSALHAAFSNGELARIGEDATALRVAPALARFLRWIADKPPDFHAPTQRRRR